MGKSTLKNIMLAVVALFGATFALAMPAMGQVIGTAAAATTPSFCGEWTGTMEVNGNQEDYTVSFSCNGNAITGKTRYRSRQLSEVRNDPVENATMFGDTIRYQHSNPVADLSWELKLGRDPSGKEILIGGGSAYNTPMRVTVYPTLRLSRRTN